MPNELEQELLELARQQREANQKRETVSAQELAELPPGLLLSASALGEVEAAANLQSQVVGYTPMVPTPEAVDVHFSDPGFIDTELGRVAHDPATGIVALDIETRAPGMPNANGDIYAQELMGEWMEPEVPESDLENLFMNREAQEAQEAAGLAPAEPNYGWQQRPSGMIAQGFQRHYGGMDRGRGPDTAVVSERRPDGTWAARPLPRPQTPPQRHTGVSMGTRVQGTQRAPQRPPEPQQPAGPRANRYAVLTGDDLIDD